MSDLHHIRNAANRVRETYGSKEVLADHLDKAVEMLFYVEEGTFERTEIQNVVAALRDIVGILRQTK